MTSPAIGYNHIFRQVLYHAENVCVPPLRGLVLPPLAMVPTFSFTSPNIVDRLPFIAPIRISFIHSLIASSMLCIGSYPRLTEQAGKQRYKDSADKGNAAARHELLNAL